MYPNTLRIDAVYKMLCQCYYRPLKGGFKVCSNHVQIVEDGFDKVDGRR